MMVRLLDLARVRACPVGRGELFRGFLWHGVQSRYGKWAAFVVATLLFAAMHYNYWMAGGHFNLLHLVLNYVVPGSVLRWLRWRSGSTVATMIAHAVSNAVSNIVAIVLSALVP